jgi:hypothetical protein
MEEENKLIKRGNQENRNRRRG